MTDLAALSLFAVLIWLVGVVGIARVRGDRGRK